MDGKEQLRRYLEQRREAGERDLLLDDMTVDDVLRIVGASTAAARPADEPIRPASPPAQHSDPGDWRAVLAAADRTPARRDPASADSSDVPPEAPRRGAGVPSALTGAVPSVTPEAAVVVPAGTTKEGAASEARWPSGLAVGQPHTELFGGPLSALSTLDELAAVVAGCTRCPLYATATHPVPGEGSPVAPLVCVGEAPGATEDATGRPFVGQAGKLLDKILARDPAAARGRLHLQRVEAPAAR